MLFCLYSRSPHVSIIVTDWMCPPQIHMLNPNPNAMVLGAEVLGRQLGLDDIRKAPP